jgi:hypothetical protein
MTTTDDVLLASERVEVSAQSLQRVAGVVELDDSVLGEVSGGEWYGRYYTVSAECFFGISCNPWSGFNADANQADEER